MTLGFLFFRPCAGDMYRPDEDLLAEAHRIHEELGDDMSATTDPEAFRHGFGDPHPGRPAPRGVAALAAWVNEHADVGGGHGPREGEAFSLLEFPVEVVNDALHVALPFSEAGETGRLLQLKACDLGLCMVDDMEQIWVNPTGVDRGLRMRSSVGTVTTHVDAESVRSTLLDDADRRERSDDGIPYVVVETGLSDGRSPMEDTALGHVRFVQAALLGNGWVVEYRTKRSHFRRHAGDLESVVADVAAFADGDVSFLTRGWDDATAETVRR
ncbi:hypothetical protein PQI66_10545 [Corynebacterium sp. USCH3]|uniref:hypothetical protein n=1 Tax=Corynebacterium sp. USCH3 TaxID=3024840 RepID=UPI0030979F74